MNSRPVSNVGVTQRFQPGEYRRVETLVEQIKDLGIARVCTSVAWEEFETATGRAWYEWLIPALATRLELLPSLLIPVARKGNGHAQIELAQFIREFIDAFGAYFSTIELTSAHGNLVPDLASPRVTAALSHAVEMLHGAGKHVVLGGLDSSPSVLMQLHRDDGLLGAIDIVGLKAHMAPSDLGGSYWPLRLEAWREALRRHGSAAEIWITDAGFEGHSSQKRAQLRAFTETADAPSPRFYWNGVQAPAGEEHASGCLLDPNGAPGLLARLLAEGGPVRVREMVALSQRGRRHNGKGVALITGGAGFIGTNLAARLLGEGRSVRIFDNLSRPGTEHNLRWLAEKYGEKLEFRLADVRDRLALREAVVDATEVFHFAAQVAVTTSLVDPVRDFEINGRGTLNLLEELRRIDRPPPLLFTSTNKVYGSLEDIPLNVSDSRYELADPHLRERGIDESRNLTFCSPYGCSKGASDQYVLDFARTFHLPAAVLRMSCIYGPHQFGTEDQGWVAHFARRALGREPIVVYGDGRQVRDVLFVEDLVDALLLARDRMESLRGQPFNIGGGPRNSVSLRELISELSRITGIVPQVSYESWRVSDQRYYVSDVSRFQAATGWSPRTSMTEGLERLTTWLATQNPAHSAEPMAGRAIL